MAEIAPEQPIVYVDECGVEQHMTRERAWSSRGERVISFRPGKRYKRINVIAGKCDGEVLGEAMYDWSTNSQWFEVWFEWHLCPKLKQNSVIIMDNARFHRKSEIERIAHFYVFSILWLPPYSPDKNKIELLWANLKNWLRLHAHLSPSIQLAISSFFKLE